MAQQNKKPDFIVALDLLSGQIMKYRNMKVLEGNELNVILQQITGTLFYLEKERAKYHDLFQVLMHRLINENQLAVNRAENQAHIEIPEMYMLRRVMDSGYEVVNAIRSNISWLKNEKEHSKQQQ